MKVRWITNTPTPYRNHRHRLLAARLDRDAVDYAVYYMAWTEPDRHWGFRPGEIDHPHRVFAGIHPTVGGVHAHLNPAMLRALAHDRPDLVVIGGWSIPSAVLSPLVTRRAIRLLGVESHAGSVRRGRGPASLIRRALTRVADGFVVPGPSSRELVESIDPRAAAKPFLLLPNLVDEQVWQAGVRALDGRRDELRAELSVRPDQQLWVCPARLEPFKGVDTLIPLLRERDDVVLVVAGTGSQQGPLDELARATRAPVRWLGQVDQPRIQALYAAADLMVLPSRSDPNPLSAIEAAAAGLPLWLSTRCGNCHQLVVEDDNGWLYDPDRGDANLESLRRILALSRDELRRRGHGSRRRYEAQFGSAGCIDRFGGQVVDLLTRRRT